MKKIYITQRIEEVVSYKERRDCLDQKWSDLLLHAGYVPIIVPNNIKILKELLVQVNPQGIILTGGSNLANYGGDTPERDEVEKKLLEFAIQNKIPILGVCRGMQFIMHYYGVELVQVDNHIAKKHIITGVKEDREVNSYHSLGALKVPSFIEIKYCSSDGVIEEIQLRNEMVYGQMWHPERNNPFDEKDINRLKEIFN